MGRRSTGPDCRLVMFVFFQVCNIIYMATHPHTLLFSIYYPCFIANNQQYQNTQHWTQITLIITEQLFVVYLCYFKQIYNSSFCCVENLQQEGKGKTVKHRSRLRNNSSSLVLISHKAHALQMSSPITQLLANELPNSIITRPYKGLTNERNSLVNTKTCV